jgi:hypothetical protein
LKNTEELKFVKIFVLFFSGFYLINKFDFGILVDGEYFEKIGADSVVFLGPKFYHLQCVLILILVLTLCDVFECKFVLVFLDEYLLLEYEGFMTGFVL